MKQEKKQVALTGLVTLLPILIGLILWNKLPDRVPVHFDFSGAPDGYSSKVLAVFGIPLFLLAMHLLCAFATARDPKNGDLSPKINRLVLWICPVMSLLLAALVDFTALGYAVDVSFWCTLCLGLSFLILGNYLPKCRFNYTIGIRIPWTLANEENWRRTHRMAGPLWMLGGLLLILTAFLRIGSASVLLLTLAILTLAPVFYSYRLHRKSGAE